MPVTPNGLVYTTTTTITQTQSITGSFVGLMALASGSVISTFPHVADIVALKDLNGRDMVPQLPSPHLFLPAGTMLTMNFTSASLHTTSAPVMFFIY
jgi:hypothetical protein